MTKTTTTHVPNICNQPTEVINVLEQQKESFLTQITVADTPDEFRAILNKLHGASIPWIALGYGYKAAEIATHVRHKANRIFCETPRTHTKVRDALNDVAILASTLGDKITAAHRKAMSEGLS